MKMVLLEDHRVSSTSRGTINMRTALLSLSTFTCTTQEVITHSIWHVVSARKEVPLMKGFQIISGTRLDSASLSTEIVYSSKACMRQPLLPEKNFLLC